MITATKVKEVIELPDFHSHSDVARFITFLEERIECYGVKSLLYNSRMILNHLEGIDRHRERAEKILVRVNGSITDAQKLGYKRRTLESITKKFYSTLSDNRIDVMLKGEGYVDSAVRHYTREKKIALLTEMYVKKEFNGEEG